MLKMTTLALLGFIIFPVDSKSFPHNVVSGGNTLRWQSCQNPEFRVWFRSSPSPGLLCGEVELPLVYSKQSSHPSDGTQYVRLALTRLPATGKKMGSVVMINGGPGQSGIDPLLGNDANVDRLRQSYDIIGYDPRGVGESTPKISCLLGDDFDNEIQGEDIIGIEENHVRSRIAACIKQTGSEVLQHISTDEAVNDVEMIRQALGEQSLTAVAYSYGTKVAALYAERFPTKVRALVLDGVVDLSEDMYTQELSQARGFQRTFMRFASYCSQTACPLGRTVNQVKENYKVLLRKLHEQPLTMMNGNAITSDDVISITELLLLEPERWQALAYALGKIADGHAGTEVSALLDEVNDGANDALNVINCADGARPEADMQLKRRQRQEVRLTYQYSHFLPLSDYPLEICDLWPFRGKDKPHLPVVAPGTPQLLFVAQRYDPTTPHHNAEKMARAFRSPLVTRERDGHTLVLSGDDSCVDKTVVDYLMEPEKPRADMSCF